MIDLQGYHLTFDDEFNTRSISQTGAGTTWADIRQQWRLDANSDIGFGHSSFVDPASGYDPFNVSNGALTITAVPDRTPSGVPGSWESGLITTQGGFSQTYGYFEMRADLSNQPGGWDAFWLLPVQGTQDPNNTGRWQELDAVEHYGDYPRSVYNTIHTTDPAPNVNWQQDLQVYSEMPQAGGYHTYGMDWEPDRISFYVDGQLVGSQPTPSDMHSPMYLLANLATQNYGTNNADLAGVPISDKIDYIRVYSKDPNVAAVAHDTVSAPDGHDPGLYGATTAGSAVPSAPVTPPTISAGAGTGSGDAPATVETGASGPATIGSGTHHLVLQISQDAYQGDAQYTVAVDGRQIGGVQTAHAAHAAGQSEQVTVNGDWNEGDHTLSITFLNDHWDGVPGTDRNLYVDGISQDGVALPDGSRALMSQGAQDFAFHSGATPPSSGTGMGVTDAPSGGGDTAGAPQTTGNSTDAQVSIGTGANHLVLQISEDAYQGDAQYTVAVDGRQIGGVQTAHASHAAGQSEQVMVSGDWGAGDHTLSVTFLNDHWDGTPGTDRNLYVDGISQDGTALSGGSAALMSQGPRDFAFNAGATPEAPGTGAGNTAAPTSGGNAQDAPMTSGSGADHLVLQISEDAFQGDAQYTVAVDGRQIGGVQTAHASHATGQSEQVTVNGDWGPGDHTLSITFLNDHWDGTPGTDRNLYVDGISHNGAALPDSSHALMSQGPQDLVFHVESTAPAAASQPAAAEAVPVDTTATPPTTHVISDFHWM